MVDELGVTYDNATNIEHFLNSDCFMQEHDHVNIAYYFNMINSTGPYLITKQKGYPMFSSTAPCDLNSTRIAKTKTRLFLCGFARICQLVNQNFVKILEYWFKSRPNDFLHLVNKFTCDSKALNTLEDEIRRKNDKSFSGLPPNEFIFYVKERLHCSNKLYNEFRLWLDLEYILGPEKIFDTLKLRYNKEVWNIWI